MTDNTRRTMTVTFEGVRARVTDKEAARMVHTALSDYGLAVVDVELPATSPDVFDFPAIRDDETLEQGLTRIEAEIAAIRTDALAKVDDIMRETNALIAQRQLILSQYASSRSAR
jgi:hypothetical protein